MARYDLSEEEFKLIEDLIPRSRWGRPPNDPRTVLNGMFWVLSAGTPWRDLPERYGKWQSVYHRFNAWRASGVFDKMLERLQMKLDEQGKIDWQFFCVDGTNIRASRAAAGARKKGAQKKSRKTTP